LQERTLRILAAAASGATVGAIVLFVRYAPKRPAPSAIVTASTAPLSTAPLTTASHVTPMPKAPTACPEDMVLVEGDFCPALEYRCMRPAIGHGCAEYVRDAHCLEPTDARRYCIDRYEWPNKLGERPRVYVDWFEAKAACSAVGKRLCRRSEWTLACEGPKRLPYPWGYVRQPSPCNIDRAAMPFNIGALVDDTKRAAELERLWQGDVIGTHPDCMSAYGAIDQAGNVDEWTDNQLDDPTTEHVSTLNGGYWGPVRDTCRLTTRSHGPTFKFYQVGFRCCGDAQDHPSARPRLWIDHDDHRGPRARDEGAE
jgi:hypothetical protein